MEGLTAYEGGKLPVRALLPSDGTSQGKQPKPRIRQSEMNTTDECKCRDWKVKQVEQVAAINKVAGVNYRTIDGCGSAHCRVVMAYGQRPAG